MKVTGSGEVAGKHPGAEVDSWVISAPSEVARGSWWRAHATRSHASQRHRATEVLHDGLIRETAFCGHRAMGYSARTEKERRRELAAPAGV